MPCSRHSSGTGTPASACFRTARISLSVKRDFFMQNLLRIAYEKILLLSNATSRGDYHWLSVAATSNPYKKPFKKFSPARPGSSGLCRRNDPACRQNSPSLNRQGETCPPKSRGLVTLPDTQIGETAHVVQPW